MSGRTFERRGYLLEDLRLFSLCDEPSGFSRIDFHYHEFHKLILFRGGCASYSVEGRHYELEPGDVLIIGRGCVHRPEVRAGAPYSRAVLYLSPEFLRSHSGDGCDLELCFAAAAGAGSYAVRIPEARRRISGLFSSMEEACAGERFGAHLLARSLAIQLVIELTRLAAGDRAAVAADVRDEKTLALLRYVNENLAADITIDALSERFFTSKYHMMRKFRAETGYTIHAYISNKRLLMARELISSGAAATEACFRCGFRDYSAFSRAYRKLFGASPGGRRQYEITLPSGETGQGGIIHEVYKDAGCGE